MNGSGVDIKIPYGKMSLELSLSRNRCLGVLETGKVKRKCLKELLAESFDNVLGKKGLEELVADKKKVLVVVPDATRSAHLKEIVPPILARIKSPARSVSIIVATGLHRKHTEDEIRELFGPEIVKEYEVISHGQVKDSLMDLGKTKTGVPVVLNKNLKEHDFIMTIGVVEPHLYAGYSGGFKTVAVGLAGEDTINVTHGIDFLDDPLTALGSVKDNPFQDALSEIAGKVRIDFSINIVNDADANAVRIFSGETGTVFREAVEFSKRIFEIETKSLSDIVICGIGYPKDINLYQASRAINYIVNVDSPVIKKGGVLIIAAELRDGAGVSSAEIRFYERLKAMSSPEEFIEAVKREGCIAGEHRAYMVAKPLVDYNIVFVSKSRKELMKGLPFRYFESVSDALSYADKIAGEDSKIYVVPRALSTIPRLKKG